MTSRSLFHPLIALGLVVFLFVDGQFSVRAFQPPEPALAAGSTLRSSPASTSDDSGRIAYIGADSNLWLMNADGSGQQQVTAEGGYAQPSWSPNGLMIAVAREDDDIRTSEVWLISVADFSKRRIVSYRATDDRDANIQGVSVMGLEWYPDGNHLLYGLELRIGMRVVAPVLYRIDAHRDISIFESGTDRGCACVVPQDIGLPLEYAIGSTGWIVGTRFEYIDNGEPFPGGYTVLFTASPDFAHSTDLAGSCDTMEGVSWSPDEARIAYMCQGRLVVWDMQRGRQLNRTLVPETIQAYRAYTSWSPDGTMLVLSVGTEIWRVSQDGTGLTRLAIGTSAEWEPISSISTPDPSGGLSHIRPLAYKGDDSNIWLADDYTTRRRQLTSSSNVFAYAWSPDGTRIAYTTWHEVGGELHVMDADGANGKQVTYGRQVQVHDLDWLGSKVLFLRDTNGDMWFDALSYIDVDAAQGTVHDILSEIESFGGGIHHPADIPKLRAAPNGRWVAFQANPQQFAIVNTDSGEVRVYAGFEPGWQRDSSHVVYSGNGITLLNPATGNSSQISTISATFTAFSPDDLYLAQAGAELWRSDKNGGNRVFLPAHLAAEPAWSPDGARVAYTRWYPTNDGFYSFHGIYLLDRDGGNRRFLAGGSDPQWKPEFSPEIAIAHRAGAPGSAFHISCSGFPPLTPVTIRVNGTEAGRLTTNGQGALTFILDTAISAREGMYTVSLSAGGTGVTLFEIDRESETRGETGGQDRVEVPDTIRPHTDFIYLPQNLFRQP